MYVRFRGRYAETCRRKAVRRCIPSLQTNLQEARPELWNKLANGDAVKLDESEKMSFEPMDVMIRDNRWICPIKPMHQDKAYF
ncbi:UNVERIFIED_CONTAM: DNA primase, partial [Prevotella sp. 15_C9]